MNCDEARYGRAEHQPKVSTFLHCGNIKNEAQVITNVCLVEKKKKEWFLALQKLDTTAADLGNSPSRAAAGSTSQGKPLRGRIG